MPDAEQQRSRVEGSKAVLLVPSPSDALPFTDYMSLIGWSSVLWIVGYAPFIPTSPLQFLTYAPLVFGFWLGFRKSGTPWGTYALSGVAVGFLTVVLVCILGLPIQGGPFSYFSYCARACVLDWDATGQLCKATRTCSAFCHAWS